MKTETRMIIASVVVIALALTAISGVTYSWFSDDEQTEITITAGKLDYQLDITSLKDQSSYDRAETTDVTQEYNFGVSATAKIDTTTDAITLSNLADRDAITIGMNIVNNSTIASVYRVSATYGGKLCEYITPTIKVGSTEVSNATPWMNAAAPVTSATTEASITIVFDSNGATLDTTKDAKITLKVEAYQENCTDLPEYIVTKPVAQNENVSQKFSNSTSDVKTAEVSFKADSAGDYKISPITASENSSYTIQSGTTTNEVLSGISVSADGVDLSKQTAVLNFTVGSNLVNVAGTGLADAIKIVHQKSDGTTETISLTTAKAASEELAAVGDYRLTSNGDGTYTLEMFVSGFSSYLVVADADAYVVDETGKKTYYTTLGKALAPNKIYGSKATTNNVFSGDITLLRDVELTEAVAVYGFAGTFNGNGHTLICKADLLKKTSANGGGYATIAEFGLGGPVEIKNLKYKIYNGAPSALIGFSYSDLKFTNVEVLEATGFSGKNNSSFVYNVGKGTTIFEDCINRVSYYNEDVQCNAGAFVGGYADSGTTVKFINCVNYGDMRMSGPGIYFGSSSYSDSTTNVEATNCVNYGTIEYTSYGPYVGGTTGTTVVDANVVNAIISTLESGTTNNGLFCNLSDSSMALTYDGSKLSVTKSLNEDVKSYKISYTAGAELKDSGGINQGIVKLTVALDVNPDESATKYKVVDKDTFTSSGGVIDDSGWKNSGRSGYMYQIVEESIVINYTLYGCTITLSAEPTPYLSAYDSSGKLLATVAMTTTAS